MLVLGRRPLVRLVTQWAIPDTIRSVVLGEISVLQSRLIARWSVVVPVG